MKFIDILKEIANEGYSLSPAKETKNGAFDVTVDYYFETDTKREYYVRFSSKWVGRSKQPDQKYNWATELTFFPVKHFTDNNREIGGENFGRILATVIEALKKFVGEYKPEYVYWKGIVGGDDKPGSGESTKRQRIYNAIMDRETKGVSGYVSKKGDRSSGIEYAGEVPIKDSKPVFDYPEQPSLFNKANAEKKLSRFNLAR